MYITEEELKGFDTYKYSSVDTSPLSNYVMHPFWNSFVKIFPKWVAPNVMTFGGFLLLVLQTILLTWYDPKFYAVATEYSQYPPVPTWVWWVCVFTQFFSHTLDGCDGKQARRTGSSSPLGELFDHGLDSWCVFMFACGIFSIFGRGEFGVSAWQFYAILWTLMICFHLSHWEKYNTGILFLPWTYDLSQVLMAIAYALTAIFGVELWMHKIYGLNVSVYILAVLYSSGFLFSMPVCFYNVYWSRVENPTRKLSIKDALIPFISPVVAFVLLTFWCLFSPGDILNQYPRWVLMVTSVILSNIVSRLIVSQMSNNKCQPFNFLLVPLVLAVGVTFYFNDIIIELWCLEVLTVLFVLLHVHYGIHVVRQLALHLGIQVFSIKSPEEKHLD